MTDRGPHEHLRHAALDMLAAGNSTPAVAGLLGVPASVVARWRDEPVPPRLDPAALLAAHGAQGRPIRFDTTLVFGASWLSRAITVAGVVVVACSVAAGWAEDGRNALNLLRHPAYTLFFAAFVALCVRVYFWRAGPLLLLGKDAIVVPGLLRKKTLPYAELADYWLVSHVKDEDTEDEREGRLLTLHSRRTGVRPLEVFLDDRFPLDPRVIDRLALVKKANQGTTPLTPLQQVPRA